MLPPVLLICCSPLLSSTVGSVLDRIADQRSTFILDCSNVAFFDSTAAQVIEASAQKARRSGVRFMLVGIAPDTRVLLETHGVKPPLVDYAATIDEARAMLRQDAQK